jgi:hypothetical protein
MHKNQGNRFCRHFQMNLNAFSAFFLKIVWNRMFENVLKRFGSKFVETVDYDGVGLSSFLVPQHTRNGHIIYIYIYIYNACLSIQTMLITRRRCNGLQEMLGVFGKLSTRSIHLHSQTTTFLYVVVRCCTCLYVFVRFCVYIYIYIYTQIVFLLCWYARCCTFNA